MKKTKEIGRSLGKYTISL